MDQSGDKVPMMLGKIEKRLPLARLRPMPPDPSDPEPEPQQVENTSDSTGPPVVALAVGYLLVLAVVEILTSLVPFPFNLILHGAALLLFLLHAGLNWDAAPFRYIPLTLALAPLSRLILMLILKPNVPVLYRCLCLVIPSLAALGLVLHALGLFSRPHPPPPERPSLLERWQ